MACCCWNNCNNRFTDADIITRINDITAQLQAQAQLNRQLQSQRQISAQDQDQDQDLKSVFKEIGNVHINIENENIIVLVLVLVGVFTGAIDSAGLRSYLDGIMAKKAK